MPGDQDLRQVLVGHHVEETVRHIDKSVVLLKWENKTGYNWFQVQIKVLLFVKEKMCFVKKIKVVAWTWWKTTWSYDPNTGNITQDLDLSVSGIQVMAMM